MAQSRVSSQKSIQIGIASNVIQHSDSFEITPFTRFKTYLLYGSTGRHFPTDLTARPPTHGNSDATTSHAFESLAVVTAVDTGHKAFCPVSLRNGDSFVFRCEITALV